MRQRVMIAMALALDPQVMIMDEPTTALDVVVQRGILREIMRLRDELGFAVIFITHDLPLLLEISDRIAVMLRRRDRRARRRRADLPRSRSTSVHAQLLGVASRASPANAAPSSAAGRRTRGTRRVPQGRQATTALERGRA